MPYKPTACRILITPLCLPSQQRYSGFVTVVAVSCELISHENPSNEVRMPYKQTTCVFTPLYLPGLPPYKEFRIVGRHFLQNILLVKHVLEHC